MAHGLEGEEKIASEEDRMSHTAADGPRLFEAGWKKAAKRKQERDMVNPTSLAHFRDWLDRRAGVRSC